MFFITHQLRVTGKLPLSQGLGPTASARSKGRARNIGAELSTGAELCDGKRWGVWHGVVGLPWSVSKVLCRPMRSPAPEDVCSPKDRNYGELWGIMGNDGELWGFMGFHGVLWGIVGNCGVSWGCMRNYGEFWGFVGNYGELWGIMGKYPDVCATQVGKTFIHHSP